MPKMWCKAFLILSLLLNFPSQARDNGEYARVSPDIKTWIEGLTDELGVNCCAISDGVRPEEAEWDVLRDRYRVKIQGRWYTVPNGSVIKSPNRLGYAVVWYYSDTEFVIIRCFLPGSGS